MLDIIYTYCVYDDDVKSLCCGFPYPKLFFDCASLSLQLSKDNKPDNIVIYTSEKGKDILTKNVRNIKDCEFVITDFSKYEYDKRYWNFAKMVTYSMQSAPFLHIDFDVFLDKNCLDNIDLSADIYTEKMRSYSFEKNFLKYCLKKGTMPEKIICSGLLGGRNLQIFRENFKVALENCKPTKKKIEFEDLYAIEEFNLTLLAHEKDLVIHEIDEYSFIHFQGEAKHLKYYDSIQICKHEYEKKKEFIICP